MAIKLVIFDLDGTLLDTLEDLRQSLNAALGAFGLPPRALEQVRLAVGDGIRRLIMRSVPQETDPAQIQQLYDAFLAHYARHCADHTHPYPGIPELLRALRQAGLQTAVVSNKADSAAKALCQGFFPGLLDAVAGEKEGIPRKPAPEGIYALLESLGVDGRDAVYVGDSEVDIQTARNANLPCISVDWGFRSRKVLEDAGARVILSSPAALAAALLAL